MKRNNARKVETQLVRRAQINLKKPTAATQCCRTVRQNVDLGSNGTVNIGGSLVTASEKRNITLLNYKGLQSVSEVLRGDTEQYRKV